jgi:hypothetical protein
MNEAGTPPSPAARAAARSLAAGPTTGDAVTAFDDAAGLSILLKAGARSLLRRSPAMWEQP